VGTVQIPADPTMIRLAKAEGAIFLLKDSMRVGILSFTMLFQST
jgi:hypothetical protein